MNAQAVVVRLVRPAAQDQPPTPDPDGAAAPRRGVRRADLMKQIYDEHYDALFSFAHGKCNGDRQSAEDVVQETMVRMWRRIGRTDFDRDLRPLLFTMARHILIDRHRARQARPQEADEGETPEVPTIDESERCLSRMLIEEALSNLSLAHRETIAETYLVDRKVRDAALVLGVPQGTVKSRMHYALREMRTTLAEKGITAVDCAA